MFPAARLRAVLHRIEPRLAALYRRLSEPPPPNLVGDRDVEYSWVQAHMPRGPGRALEFGSAGSTLWLVAVRRGFAVTAVDLEPAHWYVEHPSFKFVQADLFSLNLPPASLDLVINCSTVEHVGLSRYGGAERADGDLAAMRHLCIALRQGGTMLLTIPVGVDATIAPLHRVYGRQRLPRLLEGYKIALNEFWMKNAASNRWRPCTEDEALAQVPGPHLYALGCFVLEVVS